MNERQRLEILKNIKDRGYTLSGWCRANGFPLRTVQDFFYKGVGLKQGGERSRQIIDALERQGLLLKKQLNA